MWINRKLKELLDKKGIKQSFICQETGMTNDALSRILACKRKITGEELLNICYVINEDPRSLIRR